MTRVLTIALVACLTTSIARAQEPAPDLTLLSAVPSRWDVAAHVTWLGERRTGPSFAWDRWINVASAGGMVGYYWTPHLKTELDISTSTDDEIYSIEPIALPGTNTLFPLQRDHTFHVSTASVGLVAQFFENAGPRMASPRSRGTAVSVLTSRRMQPCVRRFTSRRRQR